MFNFSSGIKTILSNTEILIEYLYYKSEFSLLSNDNFFYPNDTKRVNENMFVLTYRYQIYLTKQLLLSLMTDLNSIRFVIIYILSAWIIQIKMYLKQLLDASKPNQRYFTSIG